MVSIGCTSSSAIEPGDLPLPAKNIEQWDMPLDPYVPDTSFLVDYAENLLVSPCMTQAGFDWAVPWQDIHQPPSPTRNATDLRIFTRTIAAEFGYRDQGSNLRPNAAWREVAQSKQQISAAEEQALINCLEIAREALPLLDGSTQVAIAFSNDALRATQEDPRVKAAAQRWVECMRPAGVSDLPDSPFLMPTDALKHALGISSGKEPSAEEIRLAVLDADCRESSGWRETAYETEWELQLEALIENADDLERFRQTLSDHQTLVMKVIAENAPSAP